MTRDLNEVVKSQQIMRGKDPNTLPIHLFDSHKKLLKSVKVWDNKEPSVEMIYLNYKDVINNPNEAIEKVTSFIGLDFNKKDMATCVDEKLYRNRTDKTKTL